MDREYMLYLTKLRLDELHTRYKLACVDKDKNGNPLKSNTAATLRGTLKRDYQIASLIYALLQSSKAVYITDDDAIDGFHKLMEPCERHSK